MKTQFRSRVAIFILLTALVPVSADAWQLRVTGENLVWSRNTPSPAHFVGIENPTASADPLFAWSLGLTITPDPAATGLLEFAGATFPDDYLLDGRSGGLVPAFSGPSTSISPIGDSDSLFTGIIVPATGKNLLATTFTASLDAAGTFYISAIPDEFTGSNWFSSDFQNVREFQNVSFGGGPVVIGSVTIVPEPSTMLLVSELIAAVALLVYRRRWGSDVANNCSSPANATFLGRLRCRQS